MRNFDVALLIPISAVIGPMLLIGVGMLIKAFRHIVTHWRDVSLKIRLVEVGMGVEEIERIVNAGRYEVNHQIGSVQCETKQGKPPTRPLAGQKPPQQHRHPDAIEV